MERVLCVILGWKSLGNKNNSRGHKLDPCGTPDVDTYVYELCHNNQKQNKTCFLFNSNFVLILEYPSWIGNKPIKRIPISHEQMHNTGRSKENLTHPPL